MMQKLFVLALATTLLTATPLRCADVVVTSQTETKQPDKTKSVALTHAIQNIKDTLIGVGLYTLAGGLNSNVVHNSTLLSAFDQKLFDSLTTKSFIAATAFVFGTLAFALVALRENAEPRDEEKGIQTLNFISRTVSVLGLMLAGYVLLDNGPEYIQTFKREWKWGQSHLRAAADRLNAAQKYR